MNWSWILAMMFGLFVGNFLFQGVLTGDFKRGLMIGVLAALIFPFLYIPAMLLWEKCCG